jgi:alanine-glyoxylate transaminase/serine-glyoxylate transaminase/serine-pyruvate transaminase
MKGKVWRIGLMGESCRRASVLLVLSAIEQALQAQGRRIAAGAGLAAAAGVYES